MGEQHLPQFGITIPPLSDPAIPAFLETSVKRLAAYKAHARFCQQQGFPYRQPIERRRGTERVVEMIATAPDGQEYCIGFEWTEIEDARHA